MLHDHINCHLISMTKQRWILRHPQLGESFCIPIDGQESTSCLRENYMRACTCGIMVCGQAYILRMSYLDNGGEAQHE